jgi:glucan 1,3-beta-glucosidase
LKLYYMCTFNTGSWFIPEQWMVDFYDGTGATDLCSFGKYNRTLANERMSHHLATWITESDFIMLQSQGINSVRLPLGYWNVIDDEYNIYVPTDVATSLRYVDKAFDLAMKYNMTVLLDLHGAPGSQNGNDHSGCGNGIVGWNTPRNIDMSVQVMGILAKRYGSRKNLAGFELLNEPAWSLEEDHISLQQYYSRSFHEIRKYSPDAIVAFNVLYSEFYDLWDSEFPMEQYHGMVVDWHLYDCFGDRGAVSTEEHIAMAESWGLLIATHSLYHPIYVGEWSLATGEYPGGQAYADAQENSYLNGLGFYFWSVKLVQNKDSIEWSFQSALKAGYIL